jgi:hypothetical protein
LPIKLITINSFDELTNCLQNLPSELYQWFWETVIINKPDTLLWMLAYDIKQARFHCDNKQALATAILANYSRFGLKQPILFWLAETSDVVFLQEALRMYDTDQIAQALKEHNKYGYTPLQRADTPEFVKMALEYLPQDQRLDVVNALDKRGCTLVITASRKPNILNALFESLTEIQRPEVIKIWDGIGTAVLSYFIRQAPKSLELILSQFPHNQRFDVITQVNTFGDCALSAAAENPSTLKVILGVLPEDKRLALLTHLIGDQSILSLLLANGIMISPKEAAFQDSFVPHYIAVCHFLNTQASLSAKTQGFFNPVNHAAKLSNELGQYHCFDDIQQHLLDYTYQNPSTPLTEGIIRILSEWPSLHTSLFEPRPLEHALCLFQ